VPAGTPQNTFQFPAPSQDCAPPQILDRDNSESDLEECYCTAPEPDPQPQGSAPHASTRSPMHWSRACSEGKERKSRSSHLNDVISARPGGVDAPAFNYATSRHHSARATPTQWVGSTSGSKGASAPHSSMFPVPQDPVHSLNESQEPALPYENLRRFVSAHRSTSARLTPPASPYSNPRSPHAFAMPRGNGPMSGDISGRLSSRGVFPAYDAFLSGNVHSADCHSRSIEMMPGIFLLPWLGPEHPTP
jgi:hypothetical protein